MWGTKKRKGQREEAMKRAPREGSKSQKKSEMTLKIKVSSLRDLIALCDSLKGFVAQGQDSNRQEPPRQEPPRQEKKEAQEEQEQEMDSEELRWVEEYCL